MLLPTFLLSSILLWGTGANPRRDANLFMDTVLNVVLPIESGTAQISTAPIGNLTVAGPSTVIELTNGVIKGQASLFKRDEDCDPARCDGKIITLHCNLSLPLLLASYTARNRDANDTINVAFLLSSADLVPVSLREQPGHYTEVGVKIPTRLFVKKLDVTSKTQWCCGLEVHEAVMEETRNFLATHFWPVLSTAFRKIKLPYPEQCQSADA